MSDQKYKRTNFDEDEITSNGGTPPGVTYDASVSFKLGATWWQLRTLLEKILLVLVLIFIVVVVILAAVLATTKTTLSPKKGKQISFRPKKKLFVSCNPTLTSFYSKKSLP